MDATFRIFGYYAVLGACSKVMKSTQGMERMKAIGGAMRLVNSLAHPPCLATPCHLT
jgi:hypothetical protein